MDDADVEVLDQHQDTGAGVGSADADVVQAPGVAHGEFSELVDAAAADPVVGVGAFAGGGFGAANTVDHMPGSQGLSAAIGQGMETLSRRRPVFHSEFDFQFALCHEMEQAGVSRIRLERRVQLPANPRFAVDIMGYLDGTPIALEVKYPKKRFVGTVSADGYEESFNLPSSDATDLDAYGIWKDASRIEALLAAEIVRAGAVIALSNYAFWEDRSHRLGTQAHDFRLWQGREVEAGTVLSFPEAKWVTREYSPVQLRSSYRCEWSHYSEPLASEFRYLVLSP